MLSKVLHDIPGVIQYVDDILIHSKVWQSHLHTIDLVLNKLSQANLRLGLAKCHFGKDKINYLGYEVSSQGLSPLPDKVRATSLMPPPKTVKQCRQFMGCIQYYKDFLPNLGKLLLQSPS